MKFYYNPEPDLGARLQAGSTSVSERDKHEEMGTKGTACGWRLLLSFFRIWGIYDVPEFFRRWPKAQVSIHQEKILHMHYIVGHITIQVADVKSRRWLRNQCP